MAAKNTIGAHWESGKDIGDTKFTFHKHLAKIIWKWPNRESPIKDQTKKILSKKFQIQILNLNQPILHNDLYTNCQQLKKMGKPIPWNFFLLTISQAEAK